MNSKVNPPVTPNTAQSIKHALPGQKKLAIPNQSAAVRVLKNAQGQPEQDQVRLAVRTKFPLVPEPHVKPVSKFRYKGAMEQSPGTGQ